MNNNIVTSVVQLFIHILPINCNVDNFSVSLKIVNLRQNKKLKLLFVLMPPKGGILKSHCLSVCVSPLHLCPDFVIHWGILKKLGTNVYHMKTMSHVQESGLYLKGQGHTDILKFHIIIIRVNRYKHSCPDCNFVMHGRILK
jgi:hypothetical protein